MKTAYSTFSNGVWQAFKMISKDRSESDFCRFAQQAIHHKLTSTQDELNAAWMLLDATLLFLWKFRKIQHYFLAPGVADFCASSVKEFTPDYCNRFPLCPTVDAPAGTPFTYTLGNQMPGGFALHFPAAEHRKSIVAVPQYILLSFRKDKWEDGSNGIEEIFYVAAGGDGWGRAMLQEKVDCLMVPDACEMGRVLFGLSLYMDAFPDAVVEAGAENVHQVTHYDGSRRIVNRNEIVDEEHRHSVSPHWRRGHFRLLTSARFVSKQGQTVYVRGTFVKGKAFDVMEDAPPCTANAQGHGSVTRKENV